MARSFGFEVTGRSRSVYLSRGLRQLLLFVNLFFRSGLCWSVELLESELVTLCLEGNLREVATRMIEGYGPHVLGFLVTLMRDHAAAEDVFAQTCEDLWSGLPAFERRASFQTWFYKLARHAAARFRRSPHRRGQVALSEVSELADRVRTRTLPHLRSEIKDGVAAIREGLDEADRALLVLRVDRDMSWMDIAQVMSIDDQSEEPLPRVATRLRKRFQLVKEKIRERARAMGLLGDSET